MMKFRRSIKSEKDTRPHHISIPPKDAIAIVPPKKVIKALYDYTHPSPAQGYLSFSQGDFLHVVGRENDPDWYEACNPLHNTRGLVPVTYFEPVGKTVRDSAGSHGSAPATANPSTITNNTPHDSGYQERAIMSPASTDGGRSAGRASAQQQQQQQASMGGMGAMPGMPGMAGMAGMAAAMMGKGSGAMVYGIVIYDFKAERPDELEAKEGEAIIVIAQSNPEWFVAKPITRLGGPGLIPVSFIEIRDMTTGKAATDPQEAVRRAGVPKVEEWKKMAADYKNGSIPLGKLEANSQQTLQQGMERMSLSSKSQASGAPNNGYGQTGSVTSHSRAASMAQRPQYDSSDSNLLAPVKASVPRYCFADDIFWFIIECEMSDGRYWELQRLYQDFYDLQIQLIATYPVEAGTNGGERTLPFMPGPVTYVTDNISNGRRSNLDEYIKNLLSLGPHITNGHLVKKFFSPRQGDYEIDPDILAAEEYNRHSGQSGHSSNPSQGAASRQSSADQLQATTPQTPYSTGSNFPGHQRGPSFGGLNPPTMQQQHASLSASSVSTSTGPGSALKIKVWFEEDNCVVIRMPPSMRYSDLYAKLRERRDMEKPEEKNMDMYVEYRDEVEAKYYPIENDEDLQIAVERNPKLNLSVSVVR